MSGQCSLASHAETACDDLSLQSLRPFFGDPCDDGSMHVCAANELNDFLSTHPLTTIPHTKYGKQRQKYEYRHCRCGCSFRINVRYSVDGQTCHVNVGTIPDDHFDVDENPDNRDKDKEVGKLIDALIRIMVRIVLYLSFDTETLLIVRYLVRSSWKTDYITFGSKNLGIIMKLVL